MSDRNDIKKMRLAVMLAPKYSSKRWHARVSRMPDIQVIAIYHNFEKNGILKNECNKPVEQYHQMTIWELEASGDI